MSELSSVNTDSRLQGIALDEKLVEDAKKNPAAFGRLYEKYWEAVCRFVFRRIRDQDAVQDIAQSVFIKAMKNIGKYQSRGFAFSSWLFRIAVSEVSNYTKREQARRAVHAKGADLLVLMEESDDVLEKNQAKLIKVLDQLSDKELMLVEMRFFEKRRLTEIAEILDISHTNCKVRMHRCLKKLRKLMNDDPKKL